MNSFTTADLWDSHGEQLTFLPFNGLSFGTKRLFQGKVVTLRCYHDNTLVRQLLSKDGKGKVLVIDGGASKNCALIGDNIAQLAIDQGWEGIIVNGCIRDSHIINNMNIGIKALGTCPVKTIKRNEGNQNIDVHINGVKISSGMQLYSDPDGIVLSKSVL